jgi:hypothetical protein
MIGTGILTGEKFLLMWNSFSAIASLVESHTTSFVDILIITDITVGSEYIPQYKFISSCDIFVKNNLHKLTTNM